MSTSDLTKPALKKAYGPLMMLGNPPPMDDTLWHSVLGLFRGQGVTVRELAAAVVHVLEHEKFFPAPATILEHIREARKTQGQARTAEELEQQREARTLRLASPQFRGRYGRKIEIAQDYVPPSRRALTQEPDDSQRGFGPRRMT